MCPILVAGRSNRASAIHDSPRQRRERLFVPQLADLLELAPGAAQQMAHADDAAVRGGKKRGGQHDVLDCAPSDLELRRQPVVVEVMADGCLRWKVCPPNRVA